MEQVKAEPVAWMYEHPEGHINVTAREDVRSSYEGWTETPLYATPQPASSQLLTVEDVKIIWNATWKQGYPDVHDFTARINAIIGAGERETAIATPQPAAIAAPYRASDPVAEALVARFRALPLEGDAGCDKLTDAEWLKVAEAARAFIEGDR